MKALSSREKKIAVICISLVFVFIGYQVVYKRLRSRLESIQARMVSGQRRLVKQTKLLARLRTFDETYAQYNETFGQKTPNEQVMSQINSDIEQLASRLGVIIADRKSQKVKTSDYINQYSVDLTIDSSLSEVMEFLHTIQSHPYRFDIDEVQIDKSSRRKSQVLKTRVSISKKYINMNK